MEYTDSKMDLSKIHPLQQKRTLAFINHFVMTNVQFLNSFAKNCETKLMQFERKLEKVNAAMVLLEARLSSIPELNDPVPTPESKETKPQNMTTEADNTQQGPNSEQDPNNKETTDNKPESLQHYPEYDRFIKMVQVGVPLQAVKLKVSLEGLDPDLLEKLLK